MAWLLQIKPCFATANSTGGPRAGTVQFTGRRAIVSQNRQIGGPVGNSYLAGVDTPTAAFLQNVAWETVQEYCGK
jgi:hypothetical protein